MQFYIVAGVNCEININECASNPCHGTLSSCLDNVDAYVCSCPPGWEGSRCDVDIDECVSDPCAHNGTCTDVANGYTCVCTPGWSGDDCQIDIGTYGRRRSASSSSSKWVFQFYGLRHPLHGIFVRLDRSPTCLLRCTRYFSFR